MELLIKMLERKLFILKWEGHWSCYHERNLRLAKLRF